LYTNQNLGSPSLFRCPAYPPKVYTNWFCTFGVWSDPPDSVTMGDLKEDVSVSAIQYPVDYPHLADTTSRGRMGMGGVQFYSFRTNVENEVHARHNSAANVWFFDGHAAAMTKTRLEPFGIKPLVGTDTIPSYLP